MNGDPIAALRQRDPRYDLLDRFRDHRDPEKSTATTAGIAAALADALATGPKVTIGTGTHAVCDVLEQIAEDLQGRANGLNAVADRRALARAAGDLRAIAEVVQPIVRESDVPTQLGAIVEDGQYTWVCWSIEDGLPWIGSKNGTRVSNDTILAKLRAGATVVHDPSKEGQA